MDRISEICLALLRFIFIGENVPTKYKSLTDEEGKFLYALAKRHDIAHIIALAVEKAEIEISDEVKAALRKLKMAAFYRSGIMGEEQKKITELLEKEKIKFIPLKGSVIKNFYPEEWMRTGSDIDILIHKENLGDIEKLFTEKLSYKTGITGNHDMGFNTPSGAHIEMHYKLIAGENAVTEVLGKIWEEASPKADMEYHYEMSEEMFVFYHIAHMAKHFRHGGCGIRYFIDLWLVENNVKYDKGKLDELLERGGLKKFYEQAKNINSFWLYGKNTDALTEQVSDFVLVGGVYGNAEHHVALKHRRKMRKLHYLIKRTFIKKKTLAYYYPKINKYPVLTLYYQVKRWFKIFNAEKRNRVKYEMGINMSVKKEEVDEAKKLMENLGI